MFILNFFHVKGYLLFRFFFTIIFIFFALESWATGPCENECIASMQLSNQSPSGYTEYCANEPSNQILKYKVWIQEGTNMDRIISDIKSKKAQMSFYGGEKRSWQYAACVMKYAGANVDFDEKRSAPSTTQSRPKNVNTANECLSISRRDKWSMTIINNCKFPVDFKYCFISSVAAEWPSCGNSVLGASLLAGKKINLSSPQSDVEVRSFACRHYKNVHSTAYIGWNGKNLSGKCLSE